MVNSGYRVALMNRVQSSTFNPSKMCNWLSSLWKLIIPHMEDCNSVLNSGGAKDPTSVVNWASDLLSEFRCSRHALSSPPPLSPVRPQTDWITSPSGLLKLNTSIATHKNSSTFGVGAAIRDDKGKVIATRSTLAIGSFSTDVGPFMALREGLLLAKFYNFPISIVEFSSSFVIASLSSHLPLLGDAIFIVNDIKALFMEVGFWKCQATPKSGNYLAHNLASMVFSSVRERLWLDLSLSFVFSAV
ncbi:hypothetical protein Dsin_012921 [Dipteronia sinensis]|uniref:RNase H type-1 domain-containing protein n=1 Tax=Dipteronia sinensis TaxID=43782 RepID=A0AAE0AIY5_9ROSI|nr:hypothetical protein Dsin_012921 [Dipteronia sinensis]